MIAFLESLTTGRDRRQSVRVPPLDAGCARQASLLPGGALDLVDLSCGGALVESPARLFPGTTAVVQLASGGERFLVGCRIQRCYVAVIAEASIVYRAALVFDHPLHTAVALGSALPEPAMTDHRSEPAAWSPGSSPA